MDAIPYESAEQSWWSKAKSKTGCREVQAFLKGCSSNAEKAVVVEALKGHVMEALECCNANHVLAVVIEQMPSASSQFIIDELVACEAKPVRKNGSIVARENGVCYAARHLFGCRVIQRLSEHCTPAQLQPIIQSLIQNVKSICEKGMAYSVFQNFLEQGNTDIAKALISAHGLMGRLVCTYTGQRVVESLLELRSEDDAEAARNIVETARRILTQKFSPCYLERCSRYERNIARKLGLLPRSDSPTSSNDTTSNDSNDTSGSQCLSEHQAVHAEDVSPAYYAASAFLQVPAEEQQQRQSETWPKGLVLESVEWKHVDFHLDDDDTWPPLVGVQYQ